MINPDLLAEVAEALEQVKIWRPVYEALLKTCKTKQEAMEAFLYLVKVSKKSEKSNADEA